MSTDKDKIGKLADANRKLAETLAAAVEVIARLQTALEDQHAATDQLHNALAARRDPERLEKLALQCTEDIGGTYHESRRVQEKITDYMLKAFELPCKTK